MNKEDLVFYIICLLFIVTIYYVFNLENFSSQSNNPLNILPNNPLNILPNNPLNILQNNIVPKTTLMNDNKLLQPLDTIESNSIYKNMNVIYANPLINNEQQILQEDIVQESKSNIIVNDRNIDIDPTSENIPVNSINNNLECDNNYEKIEGLNTCIQKCPEEYIPLNNTCVKRDLYEPNINNSNQVTKCNRNEIENNNNECVSCPKEYSVNNDKTYCIKTTITDAYNKSCSSNLSYIKSIDKCVGLDKIKDAFVYPKTTKYECLNNQVLIDDKCYTCNDKDILNDEKKCVKETIIEREKKELKCPDGYFYDISNNKCIKYVCPENYQYDENNKICIKFNCISGYTFDNTLKKCINNNKCNDNYIYDNGLCKKFLCEPNFTLDPETKKCKANNPEGECLNGTYNTDTKKCELCQGNIINGKCFNSDCNENNIIDDKCYVCNNNSTLYKVGEEYKCISCPDGYTYDVNNNICVSNDKYCNDKITTENKCKQCPSGHTYNEQTKKCINEQCNNNNTLTFKNGEKCFKCNGIINVRKNNSSINLSNEQIKNINSNDTDYKINCVDCNLGYYYDKSKNVCIPNK